MFRSAAKSAWEYVMNIKQKTPAELLAKYLDRKMKGERGVSDGDVESSVEKVW